jgi:hypothetical protein
MACGYRASHPPAKYLCLLLAMQRKGNRGGNLCFWVCNAQATGEATVWAAPLRCLWVQLLHMQVHTFSPCAFSSLRHKQRVAVQLCPWPLSIEESPASKLPLPFVGYLCFLVYLATQLMPGAHPPAKYLCLLLAMQPQRQQGRKKCKQLMPGAQPPAKYL